MCCVCTIFFVQEGEMCCVQEPARRGEMCCVCTVLFHSKPARRGRNVLCLHSTFSFKSQLDGGEMCCVCTVLFSFKSQLDGGEMCCVCTVLFSFKSQLDGEDVLCLHSTFFVQEPVRRGEM